MFLLNYLIKHKCICGKDTTFLSINRGYLKYCSLECSAKSDETKLKRNNTNLDRYGVDNPKKLKEFVDKGSITSFKKYGVSHPSKSESVKNKNKETCLKKYGVTSTFQLKEVRDKYGENYINNHGVKNPFQLEEVKEKIKNTNILKYGVENPQQSNEIKEKKKKNAIEKYGVESTNSSPEVKENKRRSSLKKYGVDHPNKSENFKEDRRKNFYLKLFNSNRLKDKVEPLFSLDDFKSTNPIHEYKWKCPICSNVFIDSLDCGKIPRCLKCNPYVVSTSKFENEIANFCKQYYPNLIENDRNILKEDRLEIDIYIPEIKLAIECNGLYWHSELNGKDKNYHIEKSKKCFNKGINLIHIFEDEWYDKEDIVKSILLAKMGKIPNKIYARKCIIKKVNQINSNKFLFENHLQGPINGKSIGLYYNDELVSIIVYSKPRFNKNYDIEILRFCNKKDFIIPGSLSKLVSNIDGRKISYCDKRYSEGRGYISSGFKLIGESPPNYFYLEKSYQKRFSRIQFQKHKLSDLLENFNPILNEWQNMQLNGYDRIWDCGNLVFSI